MGKVKSPKKKNKFKVKKVLSKSFIKSRSKKFQPKILRNKKLFKIRNRPYR